MCEVGRGARAAPMAAGLSPERAGGWRTSRALRSRLPGARGQPEPQPTHSRTSLPPPSRTRAAGPSGRTSTPRWLSSRTRAGRCTSLTHVAAFPSHEGDRGTGPALPSRLPRVRKRPEADQPLLVVDPPVLPRRGGTAGPPRRPTTLTALTARGRSHPARSPYANADSTPRAPAARQRSPPTSGRPGAHADGRIMTGARPTPPPTHRARAGPTPSTRRTPTRTALPTRAGWRPEIHADGDAVTQPTLPARSLRKEAPPQAPAIRRHSQRPRPSAGDGAPTPMAGAWPGPGTNAPAHSPRQNSHHPRKPAAQGRPPPQAPPHANAANAPHPCASDRAPRRWQNRDQGPTNAPAHSPRENSHRPRETAVQGRPHPAHPPHANADNAPHPRAGDRAPRRRQNRDQGPANTPRAPRKHGPTAAVAATEPAPLPHLTRRADWPQPPPYSGRRGQTCPRLRAPGLCGGRRKPRR